MKTKTSALVLLGLALLGGCRSSSAPTSRATASGAAAVAPTTAPNTDPSSLPLVFEANQGQADPRVKFLARGGGSTLFLTSKDAWLVLEGDTQNVALRLTVAGGAAHPVIAPSSPLPGKSNYLLGDVPARWHTGIPQYAGVAFQGVYSGVDMTFHGSARKELEYDFTMAPGVDPNSVAVSFDGADGTEIDADGNLLIHTVLGTLLQPRPAAYQDAPDGTRQQLACDYRAMSSGAIGFNLGSHDPRRAVMIDPTLIYSSGFGGTNPFGSFAVGNGIAVGSSGVTYTAGTTTDSTFPTTFGAYDRTYNAQDATVTELSADGATILASTFLGGTGTDIAHGIAIDSLGYVYIVGETSSADFPNPIGFSRGGGTDPFLTKMTNNLAELIYSTYLGGSGTDVGEGIAVDGNGDAYVTGYTQSSNFPLAAASQTALSGTQDAFVAKIHYVASPPSLSRTYSTYLGGTGSEDGHAIAVDLNHKAYVTGETTSSTFPVTSNRTQTSFGGATDAFLTKFGATGTRDFSTWLGGSGTDIGRGITVGSGEIAWITGDTNNGSVSPFFPTVSGLYGYGGGTNDAFVTRIRTVPQGLFPPVVLFSTFLGGTGSDRGNAIAIDASGLVFVAGTTTSTNFPLLKAVQSGVPGSGSARFLTEFNATGSALGYSTYLGGGIFASLQTGNGIAVDAYDDAFVTGQNRSTSTFTGVGVDEVSPLAASSETYNATEDQLLTVPAPGILGNDDNVGSLAMTAAVVTNPTQGTLTPNANGSFTYQGFLNANGSDSFTYRATNGGAFSNLATVTLIVAAVNDPPSFTKGADQVVNEDAGAQTVANWATSISPGPPDESSQTVAFTVTNNNNGLFSSQPAISPTGTLTYTSAPNANGSATVTVTLVDNGPNTPPPNSNTSAPQTFAITVNPVNDAPSASAGSATTNEDVPVVVTLSGADIDSASLTFSITTAPTHGTLGAISAPSCTPAGAGSSCTATVTYTNTLNYNGVDSFAFKVNDGFLDSAPAAIVVTINPVNDAPVANADAYSATEGTLLDVPFPGVLGNDTDVEGNALSAILGTGPAHGHLVLAASGAFSYTPNPGYRGPDSFTYQANDGLLSSNTATVTITVAAKSNPDTATTTAGTPVATNVVANDPGVNLSPGAVDEEHYCYDGYDAACLGTDSAGARGTTGRLSRVTDKPGFVDLTYDGAGRQTAESRVIGSAAAQVTSTSYDANGNRISVSYPSGVTISRTFDDTDRETAIGWAGGSGSGTVATGITWFPYGGLSLWQSVGSATVTTTVTEDAGGWITQIAAAAPVPTAISYAYANDGNVMKLPAAAATPNELHDSLSRLVSDRGNSIAYDDAGNRLTSAGGAIVYPDPNSDLWSSAGTTSYSFDAAGNATARGSLGILTADDGTVIAFDHPTSGRTAELRDHRNLRLARRGAAGDETYLYAPGGEMVQRTLASSSVPCAGGFAQTVTPVENYVYAGGRRIGMVRGQLTGPCGGGSGTTFVPDGAYLYFSDKMDLAHAIYRAADGAQVWTGEFDAWGVPTSASGSIANAFVLPGQIALTAAEGGPAVGSGGGLVENWNRVYDSAVGRYLEVDRVLALKPRMASRVQDGPYSYVEDAPLAYSDARGLYPSVCCRPFRQGRGIAANIVWYFLTTGLNNGQGPGSLLVHCYLFGDDGRAYSLNPSGGRGITTDNGQESGEFPSPGENCHPCTPKHCDNGDCLKNAQAAYPQNGRYSFLGPNSNTFAGNLYRTCCKDDGWTPNEMASGFGTGMVAPGWFSSPP